MDTKTREMHITAVLSTIWASAIASHDIEWFTLFTEESARAIDPLEKMQQDLLFELRKSQIRNDKVVVATDEEIRQKAEEIVDKYDPDVYFGISAKYGDSLVDKSKVVKRKSLFVPD